MQIAVVISVVSRVSRNATEAPEPVRWSGSPPQGARMTTATTGTTRKRDRHDGGNDQPDRGAPEDPLPCGPHGFPKPASARTLCPSGPVTSASHWSAREDSLASLTVAMKYGLVTLSSAGIWTASTLSPAPVASVT